MNFIAQMAKAITAFLITGYAAYQVATGVDSPAGGGLTRDEIVAIFVSAFVAGLGVYLIPNAKAPEKPPSP